VGSHIQDMYDFISLEYNTKVLDMAIFYKIGKIKNINVYVNSYMRWNENVIYLIKEPIYNFDKLEKVETISQPLAYNKTIYSFDFFIEDNLSKFVEVFKFNENKLLI
jgi:bifunctional pyridoxal-dependent enzyme with beta-cystathionase and maltose regulon repressor activities